MQKSIKKMMPSKSQFWCIFNGFLEGKWRHVGTKIKEKLIQIAKNDFLINRALAAAGAWFLRVQGSKLAPKINQKSTKNWSPRWIASWHRFLMDFGGLWEASWGGKSSQERNKNDWKTHRGVLGGLQGHFASFWRISGGSRGVVTPSPAMGFRPPS